MAVVDEGLGTGPPRTHLLQKCREVGTIVVNRLTKGVPTVRHAADKTVPLWRSPPACHHAVFEPAREIGVCCRHGLSERWPAL